MKKIFNCKFFALSSCFIFLCSCSQSSPPSLSPEEEAKRERPFKGDLPYEILEERLREKADHQLPIPRFKPEAEKLYPDVLNHPWLLLQPHVENLSHTMIQDIRSLQDAYEQVNLLRKERGMPTPSFNEDTAAMIRAIQKLQKPIDKLALSWPSGYYSVLNIPSTPPSIQGIPRPFQIYKRLLIDEIDAGFPVFLDLRVFDLESEGEESLQNSRALDLINWHLSLFKDSSSFTKHVSEDCIVFVGHSAHNEDVYNPSHGFATKDRGVFLSFLMREDHLYTLFLDAPSSILDKHLESLLRMMNRPLVEIPAGI